MAKLLLIALGIAVAMTIAGVGYYYYSFLASRPLWSFRVSTGHIGPFIIGETKEQLLNRLPNESFAPEPKPSACPKNWLEASKLSKTERLCLILTDIWVEAIPSTKSHCPVHTSINTKLRFEGGRLYEVTTECWVPE